MIRLATANTDFALRGDAHYLEKLTGWADVIGVQEAKDNKLSDHLPTGWRSLQRTEDAARMGSAILVNTEVVDVVWDRLVLGAEPFWMGKRLGMLPRYFAVAQIRDRPTQQQHTIISAHLPPFRFRMLAPGYINRLRKEVSRHRHVSVLTDANMPIGKLALALGLQGYGKGIIGICSNVHITEVKIRPWGVQAGVTDHPAVTATARV